MRTEPEPKFITIEGIEGVGKTTSMDALCGYLKQRGLRFVRTREPGGTPVSEAIRELLLSQDLPAMHMDTELMLIFAARTEHLRTVILPALQMGQWVVCDRFTDATYAYQGGGRGIAHQRIAILESWVQAALRPDLTLLLDAGTELALARARSRQTSDRIEQQAVAFFDKAREEYLRRATEEPERIRVIDASRSLTEVQTQVRKAIDRLISNNAE